MTNTKSPVPVLVPVSAYAAVSPGKPISLNALAASITGAVHLNPDPDALLTPVTIIPTEQYGVRFTYRNWRGEVSQRHVLPMRFWFGSTEWHPVPQRMMTAFDLDKQEMRDFAVDDIDLGQPEQSTQTLPTEQYEAMVEALEWYANAEMTSGERARKALAALTP